MNLSKKLSPTQFILSQTAILIVSLTLIAGLYYITNIQYQKSKNIFSNGPVTSSPKTLVFNLDQPEDNSLIFDSSIVVSGKTTPGNLLVLISADNDDLIIKSKPDGTFSTFLDLENGVNRISATVYDTTGDYRSVDRIIFYSKEKI